MHLFPLHLLEFCSREQPLDTVEPECAGAAAQEPPCPAAGPVAVRRVEREICSIYCYSRLRDFR